MTLENDLDLIRNMRLHLVLLGLCLILLLVSVEGRKKKRFKPTEAVPTQIEPPPDTAEVRQVW